MVKNLPANAGDLGSIPGSGISPGGGNGNPLQYSCLENPMDRGAWQATQSMGLQRVGYDWAHRQGCKNTLCDTLMMNTCHLISQSVQLLSRVQLFATPWITAHQASLSITSSQSLLTLMSIESAMPYRHLILCRPLLLLPPIPPSIRVFSSESTLHMRWPKYWSFSFSISPSNEHPALISFRTDLLDLLAVQGSLKSLLQHHSSKASILWRSAFFTVQLSHPYMTTGKTIALTRHTFVGKVMSLLFNMLSRLVITFLPRSKCLLVSCHLIPVSKPIESVTTSRVDSGGNYELWMIMCQYGFISYNRCITLVQDIDQGKGYACWGQGGWEVSVPSSQFCCEPKTGIEK